MKNLLLKYEDVKQEVFCEIEKLAKRVQDIIDDNDMQYIANTIFSTPSWGEALEDVFFNGCEVISSWEYLCPEGWDTSTEWRIPVDYFKMDDDTLERRLKEEWVKAYEQDQERQRRSLEVSANILGYKLVKSGDDNDSQ